MFCKERRGGDITELRELTNVVLPSRTKTMTRSSREVASGRFLVTQPSWKSTLNLLHSECRPLKKKEKKRGSSQTSPVFLANDPLKKKEKK